MNSRSSFTLMAAAAASLVLITTGCSKSSQGPSVAALTTPSAAASSAGGSAASSAPGSSSPPKGEAGLLAYSQCMRSHAVPDFPDPVGNSLQLRASQGSDLDPTSPQFIAAQKACQSLQPGGGKGGTISAAQQAEALKYSACMRENGVPNFPDPVFSNGGVQVKITGIDPNSAQFQTAQKACQSLQPGRGGGGAIVGQSGEGAAGVGGAQTNDSGP